MITSYTNFGNLNVGDRFSFVGFVYKKTPLHNVNGMNVNFVGDGELDAIGYAIQEELILKIEE